MTDGLKDKHRKAIIEILSAEERVERVVLLGSRAMGTFTATSDVDIALFGDKLTLTDHAKFAEAMDELSIPQHVDILLHKSIKNKELLKHIRRHGVEWYRRSLDMETDWTETRVEAIKAQMPNALVGGPFGSNLVSADYCPLGVPVIRGQNMGCGRWIAGEFAFVGPQKAETLSANIARPGDIVFTQRGTLGQVALVPEGPYDRYVVSQSQMKLTVDDSKADALFLYYVFSSRGQKEYIRQNAIQTGVPHTNLGILRDTPLLLPSLSEQKAIVQVLGTLDDKIELNRRMNETLEGIARVIFKSWFVDFDPVRAKSEGRDPSRPKEIADLFPESFQDSPLGEIPKGWRLGTLGDLCQVALGGDWGKDEPFDGSVKVTCLRGVDLEHLRGYGQAEAPCRWIKEKSLEKRRMSGTDVLIGGSGAGPLGRPLWVSPRLYNLFPVPLVYSNFCKCLRTESPVHAVYLDRVLHRLRESGEIWEYATGTSVPNLDAKGLLSGYRVVLAPEGVLRAFHDLMLPIYDKLYCGESARLAEMRDALLPKLLSGEIRVKDAEKIAEEVG